MSQFPVTAPIVLAAATQLLLSYTETALLGLQADFAVRQCTSLNAEGSPKTVK